MLAGVVRAQLEQVHFSTFFFGFVWASMGLMEGKAVGVDFQTRFFPHNLSALSRGSRIEVRGGLVQVGCLRRASSSGSHVVTRPAALRKPKTTIHTSADVGFTHLNF
jgi:hypothetical protein